MFPVKWADLVLLSASNTSVGPAGAPRERTGDEPVSLDSLNEIAVGVLVSAATTARWSR
jgi:hypothetical protein